MNILKFLAVAVVTGFLAAVLVSFVGCGDDQDYITEAPTWSGADASTPDASMAYTPHVQPLHRHRHGRHHHVVCR